jgi:uncharacterized protein (TIGR02266 family)
MAGPKKTASGGSKKKMKQDRRKSAAPVAQDRRRADRRQARRVPIELWIEEEEGDALYFQRAANLSAGGAYFVQTVPQPVGTVVRLKFTLPGEQSEIACTGEIVSAQADDMGMGVKFLDLDERDRARIQALVERAGK